MYIVRPSSSPHAKFAGTSAALIVPRCLPSGDRIQMPSGPAAYTLPISSTLRPSHACSPGCDFVTSRNTSPLPTEPSARTGYRMITLRFTSQLSTYRNRSSGENASPLGPVRSLVTSCIDPSVPTRYTPENGSSFRGSSKNFGNPNGGSVKYSEPSDL